MLQSFGTKPLPHYPDHSDLDEASAAVVRQARENPSAKWWDQGIDASRADYATMIEAVGFPAADLAEHARIDIRRDDSSLLPLHLFRARHDEGSPATTILFLRGSGMCMGNMPLYNGILQRLAASANALVVAPDYRLAPEHPYPAGHDDAYRAFEWLAQNAAAIGGDPSRLVLAGDSAGGMLAAATALRARAEHPGAVALMVLIAPALGTRRDSGSVARYGQGFLLDVADLAWLYRTYLGSVDPIQDPLIYPTLARDLAGLPPTFLITAGADIMRNDAEDFLRRLGAAGIPVELHRFEGTIHPFLNMGGVIPAASEAIELIGDRLRATLS